MKPRPCPADFAVNAPVMTRDQLLRHYKTGTAVLDRWIKEIGGRQRHTNAPGQRSAPADFSQFCDIETVPELMKRYGCGTKAVARWRRDVGGEPKRNSANTPLPVPADFMANAAVMTERQIREHYGRAVATIRKWCAATGVKPRPAARGFAVTKQSFQPRLVPNRATAKPLVAYKDPSRAGEAAEYLRHFGPVFRCTPTGKQDPNGTHWNRGGRTILTDDELIGRAERNGWAPDAWKDLAA